MIAVVHLVWGPMGPAPLRRFLDSYRRVPAGADHQLVILFNGVDAGARPQLLAELEGVEHVVLETPSPVQDLAAYAHAAARLAQERLCFMNSYSVLLADGWLAKLSGALDEPAVALAGASGSWLSVHSNVLNVFGLPNAYRGVLPPRSVMRAQLAAVDGDLAAESAIGAPAPGAGRGRAAHLLRSLRPMPGQLLHFAPFPARHLRTNAYVARRELFMTLGAERAVTKDAAYRLESGRASFTSQVLARGMRAVVVSRGGDSYGPERWPASNTLWQRDQEGLMVADNQTRSYENGDLDRRRVLSALAWGQLADPTPAGGSH